MMTSSYISVILYFNVCYVCFFFNDTATTEIYTLSYTTLFRSDDTWNRSDEELIAQGARELEKLGLAEAADVERGFVVRMPDRKSTRLNSSHANISYAVFCLKKKKTYKHFDSCINQRY